MNASPVFKVRILFFILLINWGPKAVAVTQVDVNKKGLQSWTENSVCGSRKPLSPCSPTPNDSISGDPYVSKLFAMHIILFCYHRPKKKIPEKKEGQIGRNQSINKVISLVLSHGMLPTGNLDTVYN